MRSRVRLKTIAASVAVAASAATAQGQTLDFSTTRVPTELLFDTLEVRSGTRVLGLNDQGQTVGSFGERNATIWGVPHAFIRGSTGFGTQPGAGVLPGGFRLAQIAGERYADPAYRYLDLAPAPYPSSFNDRVSVPNAINNAGIVVGAMGSDYLSYSPSQAYRYDSLQGALTLLNVPGAIHSEAVDVNAAGVIVGNFVDAANQSHGFVFDGTAYSVIDLPGAVGRTSLAGINDAGTIIGRANDAADPSSFILRDGSFSTFTANGLYTVAADINNAGQIVGWVGITGQRRGFYYDGAQSVILDLSASGNSTYAYAINNLGVIAGAIEDDGGVGFIAAIAAVPEPASALLALAGLLTLGGAVRTRRTCNLP